MLISEALTALRRFGFDDSDPLLVWLNAGLNEFQDKHRWSFLLAITNFSLTAGNSLISIPSDFRQVSSIRNKTTRLKLRYLEYSQFEREVEDPDQMGYPYIYTVVGDSIQVWPTPDNTYDFRMIYQSALPEMTSSIGNMPGPTRIHYPVVQAAAYLGLQAENEEDRAANAQGQFEAAVTRIWDATSGKQEDDEPQQVVDVMGYL